MTGGSRERRGEAEDVERDSGEWQGAACIVRNQMRTHIGNRPPALICSLALRRR